MESLNDTAASSISGGESTESMIDEILDELAESNSADPVAMSGYLKIKKLNSGD